MMKDPSASRVLTESPRAVASTTILVGGFTRNRLYLVEGMPGTGKTTLACNT
jgi:KaiC/GvpD/RAD55 family RecA-like ATPase